MKILKRAALLALMLCLASALAEDAWTPRQAPAVRRRLRGGQAHRNASACADPH